MDITNLIGTIFQADYIKFYTFNKILHDDRFDGYFYVVSFFELDNVTYVLCQTLLSYSTNFYHDRFLLKYSDFNNYIIYERIYYYSNVNYITNSSFLYNSLNASLKKRKRITG